MKNKALILVLTFSIFSSPKYCIGQNIINVAENTLKVKGLGEEVFYYAFAEGDQMIFSFEEENGKELKEIEIVELPSSSKFMDYKTASIQNKTFSINKATIYKFRFANSAISGRVCKFKIQRIPAKEATKNFNTSVYWHTVYDTTYTPEEERYLVSVDTTISNFLSTVVKVHSATNAAGNKTTFNFTLPANTAMWSFYIGVDQAGEQAFEKATKDFTKAATPFVSKIPEYGPMAALALQGVNYFAQIQQGQSVNYWITDENNRDLFLVNQQFKTFKYNKAINDCSQMTNPRSGTYFFCLSNENMIAGVDVFVKATAIVINKHWGVRTVQKMDVTSREEPFTQP